MNISLDINELVVPKYQPILDDILDHKHTHYIFSGGRGSTKSSFVGEDIIFIILENPTVHAAVFRKVGRTLQNSVYGQIVWAIYKLGLEQYFKIPKTIANPIVFIPTGQQIMFFGLDDPMKVKSLKLPFGYVGITWFNFRPR